MAGQRDQVLRALRAGPGPEAPPESLRKRIAIMVVAGGASLALGLSGTDSVLHGLQGHSWGLRTADVAFSAMGYVLLWWRRQRPLAFAGYILVASSFCTLTGGLPFVAALTVAIHRNWPTALVTSALLTAAAYPSQLLYPESSSSTTTMLTVAVIVFALTGWGMYLRARRLLLASLRGRAERAEQGREEHARHARIAERQRIAREMHDVLAHRLSLLSVQAGALEVTPAGGAGPAGDETVTEAAAAIRATTHQALRELRSIVRVLRDDDAASTSAPQPVAADLPMLVAESSAAAVIDADWGGVALAAVPAQSGRTLYRIVQEGLTNARKHAPASSVDVRLAGSPEQGLAVSVTSWLPVDHPAAQPNGPDGPDALGGPGGPHGDGSGAGLIGLRERAALAGGHVDVTVTPDDRFRLSAWLPWEDR